MASPRTDDGWRKMEDLAMDRVLDVGTEGSTRPEGIMTMLTDVEKLLTDTRANFNSLRDNQLALVLKPEASQGEAVMVAKNPESDWVDESVMMATTRGLMTQINSLNRAINEVRNRLEII